MPFVDYKAGSQNYPFLPFLALPFFSFTFWCMWRPGCWCMLDKIKALMTSWVWGVWSQYSAMGFPLLAKLHTLKTERTMWGKALMAQDQFLWFRDWMNNTSIYSPDRMDIPTISLALYSSHWFFIYVISFLLQTKP